jgi:predicted transcriptional regulator
MSTVTIEFGPIATAKLEELAIEAERSKTEIVRRALDVYNEIFNQTRRQGKRLILEDPKTGERENLLL